MFKILHIPAVLPSLQRLDFPTPSHHPLKALNTDSGPVISTFHVVWLENCGLIFGFLKALAVFIHSDLLDQDYGGSCLPEDITTLVSM